MKLPIALLALAAIPLAAQTERINPPGLSKPNGYTHVVVTKPGKMIFIAGQVALNAEGQMVGKGDLKAQAEQAFENLKTALAAAGATFENVVKINWYVKNLKPDQLRVLREVRNRYVAKNAIPASTLVGVTALFMEDCLIEIEATATLP